MGVSPRRLEGWEPVEVTTFEYDTDGRVVAAVTTREAEFNSADVAVLIESRRRSLAPRGPHGFLLSDASSPDADPANPNRKVRVEVPLPKRDHYETALLKEQESYYKKYPSAKDDRGLMWGIRPVPVDPPR